MNTELTTQDIQEIYNERSRLTHQIVNGIIPSADVKASVGFLKLFNRDRYPDETLGKIGKLILIKESKEHSEFKSYLHQNRPYFLRMTTPEFREMCKNMQKLSKKQCVEIRNLLERQWDTFES